MHHRERISTSCSCSGQRRGLKKIVKTEGLRQRDKCPGEITSDVLTASGPFSVSADQLMNSDRTTPGERNEA